MCNISVIVPNYNHAPYLRQRLDSIFNQTYQDFEVIILDDCSTDNSREIIEEYRSRPQLSHIVYNETTSGSPFKQWAKGFDLAKGEYIWIAESDDWAEVNFLDELVSALDQDNSLALAFCENCWEFEEKSERHKFRFNTITINGIDFIKKYQSFRNQIVNASSVLFRKRLLHSIPNNYKDLSCCGDYLFWIYLLENGNIRYIRNHLNHFRRHTFTTTTKSTASGKTFFENLYIYEYLYNQGYITPFLKLRIFAYNLNLIEKNKQDLLTNESYLKCKNLWKIQNNGFWTKMLLRLAYDANICFENISLGAKIWNILHLPNTNIREKICKFKKCLKLND